MSSKNKKLLAAVQELPAEVVQFAVYIGVLG